MIVALSLLGSVASIFTALAWIARVLDKRWRAKHPKEMPFAWGYFQALAMAASGTFSFVCLCVGFYPQELAPLCFLIFGGGVCIAYGVVREKAKWAWVLLVIFQWNPVIWIVDY